MGRGVAWLIIGLGVGCFLLPAGCGSARRGQPLTGPLPITSEQERLGQMVFTNNCYQCHPGGEAGLGPALNDKPLPGFLIKTQVRRGFGAMPSFSKDRISEEGLGALVAYMKALRRHG